MNQRRPGEASSPWPHLPPDLRADPPHAAPRRSWPPSRSDRSCVMDRGPGLRHRLPEHHPEGREVPPPDRQHLPQPAPSDLKLLAFCSGCLASRRRRRAPCPPRWRIWTPCLACRGSPECGGSAASHQPATQTYQLAGLAATSSTPIRVTPMWLRQEARRRPPVRECLWADAQMTQRACLERRARARSAVPSDGSRPMGGCWSCVEAQPATGARSRASR